MFRDNEIYKIGEIAKRCKVTRQTIYNWVTLGIVIRTDKEKEVIYLKATPIGGRYRFIGKDVNKFIKESERKMNL